MSNLCLKRTETLELLYYLENNKYLNHIHSLKVSDKQPIALEITTESLELVSELYMFSHLKDTFQVLKGYCLFNRPWGQIVIRIERLGHRPIEDLSATEDMDFIDSMPLDVCKVRRLKLLLLCKETEETGPDYGYCYSYCAMHKANSFGYKNHFVRLRQSVMKRAKGYLPHPTHHDVNDVIAIQLLDTAMRHNCRDDKPSKPLLGKTHKCTDHLFYQLCRLLMIRLNYAKTFEVLTTPILSKPIALTVTHWINQGNGNHFNNLKTCAA